MSVTLSGPLAQSIQYAKNLLAACATVQAITGSEDAAEAAAYIHKHKALDRPDPDDSTKLMAPRPRLIISGATLDSEELGLQEPSYHGELIITLEVDTNSAFLINPASDTAAQQQSKTTDAWDTIADLASDIIAEMYALAGQNDGTPLLAFESAKLTDWGQPDEDSRLDEEAPYYGANIEVIW